MNTIIAFVLAALLSCAAAAQPTTFGSVVIGTGTGVGSVNPLELVGSDVQISFSNTNPCCLAETPPTLVWMKDSAGNWIKAGVLAMHVPDGNTTSGFASWEIHGS